MSEPEDCCFQKIRYTPPVPKFRMVGGATDTPDFQSYLNSKSEQLETVVHDESLSEIKKSALSQKDSSDDSCQTVYQVSRKRLASIINEIIEQMNKLQDELGSDCKEIEEIAIKCLNDQILEKTKSKKYSCIALGCIMYGINKKSLPITLKKVVGQVDVQEKQVRKIMKEINQCLPQSIQLESVIVKYLRQVCGKIGLTEKFEKICLLLFKILEENNLIEGEHESVITGTLVNIAGNIVFASRGGFYLPYIAEMCGCSAYSVKVFLKKVKSKESIISKEFIRQHGMEKKEE